MIISHKHKFIFLKVPKTASTSVEIFFEQFCDENDIIGFRGSKEKKDRINPEWWNHMPAYLIKKKIGNKIWDSYFKFCVIRNPWDFLVSLYFFRVKHNKLDFNKWLVSNRWTPGYSSWFLIDDRFAVDYCIRFESLKEGLQSVCNKLGLKCDINKLGHYKSKFRKDKRHYSFYYNEESKKLVENAFRKEIDIFNYKFEYK